LIGDRYTSYPELEANSRVLFTTEYMRGTVGRATPVRIALRRSIDARLPLRARKRRRDGGLAFN